MSVSSDQPERFDEVEALLRPKAGDRDPLCAEFRVALVEMLEETLEETLDGAADAGRVSLSDALAEHVADCPACQRLAQLHAELPGRLSAGLAAGHPAAAGGLPDHFADLPLLRDPEALATRGLTDPRLPQRLHEAVSATSAPSELDERVAHRFRIPIPMPRSTAWRAAAAAAAILVCSWLFLTNRGSATPEIEVVLVERPFPLQFDRVAPGSAPGRTEDGKPGESRKKGEE